MFLIFSSLENYDVILFALEVPFQITSVTHWFVALWEWCQLFQALSEKMAATIKDAEEDTSKRKHIKAVLVNKLEGSSDTVNMAVTIPHEDAVISVSDDKWVEKASRVDG